MMNIYIHVACVGTNYHERIVISKRYFSTWSNKIAVSLGITNQSPLKSDELVYSRVIKPMDASLIPITNVSSTRRRPET